MSVDDAQTRVPTRAYPRLTGAFLLAVLTLVAYEPILARPGAYEFLNVDDERYIVDNPHVTSGLTADNVAWAFTSIHQSNWHPLTWLSWQLDWQMYGLQSGGFHLTNVALHVANVVVLFLALFRLTGGWGRSVTVAGLFAIHPLHVESVAWVSERKDLLSTLFFLVTILAYTAYVARPGWGRYVAVLLSTALCLMSKAMFVTLPFVLLLLDVWPLERVSMTGPTSNSSARVGWRRLFAEKVPLFTLAAGCAFVTLRAQDRMMQALPPLSLSARALNALAYYATYLGRTVWPTDLVVYRPNPGALLSWLAVVGGGALVFAITCGAWWQRARRPYLLVGWLWYLGTLVPVIGLVQVGFLATSDHYTYVPLIGVFIVVVWGAHDALARALPRLLPLLGVAVVFTVCVAITRHQLRYWRTSATLWQHVVDGSPNDAFAHAFLARGLEAGGRAVDAEAQYALASELDITWKARLSSGLTLEEKGDLAGSRRELEAVLMSTPHNVIALRHLAVQSRRRGDLADARSRYSVWAKVEPGNPEPEYNLGLLYEQSGDLPRAEAHLRRSLEIDPNLDTSRDALQRVLRSEHLL